MPTFTIGEIHPFATKLENFVSNPQLRTMMMNCQGEEGQHFFDKLEEYADRVTNMHKSYEQDGKGKDAIVHLHYFRNGMDWFITEKDAYDEQLQAFGYADLGMGGGEFGYISIEELKANNIELDLFWTPKPLKDCI